MVADPTIPIAVVIPTMNEAARIGHLLQSLSDMDFHEDVIADGGSSDGTVEIAARYPGVTIVSSRVGRGVQINAGVQATSAPVLLLLHADTVLPADAIVVIRRELSNPATVAGCFRLCFDVAHPVLGLFAWCSRFETTVTSFGDQAYFLRRQAFDAVGGMRNWPFLEDVALRTDLKKVGGFVKCRQAVVTSARRFEKHGPIRTQLFNLLILAGYKCGVPVTTLATFYGMIR